MTDLIKKLIWAGKYRRAVRKADRASRLTGLKHYVFLLGGKLKVVPKRTMKLLVARRRFRSGTTVRDIESRCLHITK